MKKILLTISLFFILCFTCLVNVKADVYKPELNKEYTYTESEKAVAIITLTTDTELQIKIFVEEQKPLVKTLLYAIDEEGKVCLIVAGQTAARFTLTPDFKATPVIKEEIEEAGFTLDGIVDYIIAFVVSFLGSSAFLGIVKGITNKGIKALKNKVSELEEQNKISAEAKQVYEKKIEELNETINSYIQKNEDTLNLIREKLNVDAEKEKEMAELLNKLLPEVAYENKENK